MHLVAAVRMNRKDMKSEVQICDPFVDPGHGYFKRFSQGCGSAAQARSPSGK